MFARVVVGILGGILLGIAGAGLYMLAFGANGGAWALLLLWAAGVAVAIAVPDLTRATRWLLISAGLAVLLLVFASALISNRLLPGTTNPLQAESYHEDTTVLLLGMLLGGLTLFAGLWIGRDPRLPVHSSNDVTDNFVGSPVRRFANVLDRAADSARASHRKLQFTLLGVVLAVGAILLWSSRNGGVNSARQQAVQAAPAAPVAAQVESAPRSEAVAEPAATDRTAPVSSSQIRKECMAQVEAARLFLAHAHASPSRGAYEVKIREDMERFQREKPVGPRTLTLISGAMWSLRETPDPDTGIWTREYTRCEQVRSTGIFYVVRGQN